MGHKVVPTEPGEKHRLGFRAFMPNRHHKEDADGNKVYTRMGKKKGNKRPGQRKAVFEDTPFEPDYKKTVGSGGKKTNWFKSLPRVQQEAARSTDW